jgi:hypothetical protein
MSLAQVVRKYCLECAGTFTEVRKCQGDKPAFPDIDPPCYFYKYRFGHGAGRVGLKTIKKFCQNCISSNQLEVLETCPSKNCPVWEYRTGKSGRTREMTDEQKKALVARLQKGKSG